MLTNFGDAKKIITTAQINITQEQSTINDVMIKRKHYLAEASYHVATLNSVIVTAELRIAEERSKIVAAQLSMAEDEYRRVPNNSLVDDWSITSTDTEESPVYLMETICEETQILELSDGKKVTLKLSTPTFLNSQDEVSSCVQRVLTNTKGKSLTPILTISEDYLRKYNLWGNTIRLSNMRRKKGMVKYDSNADVGDNLCGKISSDEILDVSKYHLSSSFC